ncbi:MAG: hypothetical protein GTO02_04195, partial [Candidatus Dadabacteria bacterium]|nr:hypothetical protein [Candidatus Dadabacteria bacterium]
MNDALRLLRKVLRHYGYDVKKRGEYNLLPIKNQEQFNQLKQLIESQDNAVDVKSNDSFNDLYICLRTCLKKDARKAKKPNVANADHRELVLRCIKSIVSSINFAIDNGITSKINLTVFDDHSDEESKSKYTDLCKKLNCEWEIRTTREPGQGSSLLEQFEFAKSKEGLFYFCEDDYLHEPAAIIEMQRFYRQIYNTCGTHLVIHPQEHEFLYIKSVYPSYLLLGEHRHWRTISHATHVLFTHSGIVSKYWSLFEKTKYVGNKKKRRLGSEAQNTNLLFDQLPGFSPIPALAA